jgi:hypothetical protein
MGCTVTFIIYLIMSFIKNQKGLYLGLRELRTVLDSLKDMKNLKHSNFFYSIGLQTVILLAVLEKN